METGGWLAAHLPLAGSGGPGVTDWMSAVGTDLAALGTVGALIFLGIQVWMLRQQTAELRRQHSAEAEARRKDELRRQAQDEQDRLDRHLGQARLVAATLASIEPRDDVDETNTNVMRGTHIDLINGSNEPVYRLVAGVIFIQGAAANTLEEALKQGSDDWVTTASILPSGRHRVWVRNSAWGILSGRIGAEVAFTDRAGSHWIRRGTGQLEEIPEEPFKYFSDWGLHGPYDLQTPEPVQ